jgi:hypothetical protein
MRLARCRSRSRQLQQRSGGRSDCHVVILDHEPALAAGRSQYAKGHVMKRTVRDERQRLLVCKLGL